LTHICRDNFHCAFYNLKLKTTQQTLVDASGFKSERGVDGTVIGIDETSCAKGHKYVTLEVDFGTSKVIHVCEGKYSNTVSIFKKYYKTHNGNHENIHFVSCDISPALISGIHAEFPNAAITFDKFHAMKMVNEEGD